MLMSAVSSNCSAFSLSLLLQSTLWTLNSGSLNPKRRVEEAMNAFFFHFTKFIISSLNVFFNVSLTLFVLQF